jgi:hypothetical protein
LVGVGARVELLVLAAEPHACVGVDVDTGAFVRARYPAGTFAELAPLDLARAEIAAPSDLPDRARPELVDLLDAPRRSGRAPGARAERLLRPLLHPRGRPLLGSVGPAVPFWTLSGDHPSVALVEPEQAAVVLPTEAGYDCHFLWRGLRHVLPLADRGLVRALDRRGRPRYRASRRRRLIVALSPPMNGYCYKVVAGLLP